MEEDAKIIDLPKVTDPRGNLSFIQGGAALPFEIERCYWVYDVPAGEERYGRALRTCAEFVVALSGSFDVQIVDHCGRRSVFHLCRGYKGLLIPPMHWRELVNFSTNSVALTLASSTYDEKDYIRDLNHFLNNEG